MPSCLELCFQLSKKKAKGDVITRVKVNPGVCGFVANVEVTEVDEDTVRINVETGCDAVNGMFQALGDTFEVFDICLNKPGSGPFYDYARENFPGHASCIMIPAILKAVEAECHLALEKDCSIEFE